MIWQSGFYHIPRNANWVTFFDINTSRKYVWEYKDTLSQIYRQECKIKIEVSLFILDDWILSKWNFKAKDKVKIK